jgi:superfamily II DNA or RNA helicase
VTQLHIFNNSCQITEEDDPKILQALDAELSYKIPGIEFSRACKGYINSRGEQVMWDGVKHLLSSSLKCAPGFKHRVIELYQKYNKPLDIIDSRTVEHKPKIDIQTNLKNLNLIPRQYQLDAVGAAINTDRGIIRLPTGSGKTLVMALIIAELGKPSIIYVIGRDLLYQTHELFENIFGTKIGMVGDGLCEIHDINVVTIWSVGQVLGLSKNKLTLDDEDEDEKKVDPEKFRLIKQMLLDSKVHIIDEAHLSACDTVQTIVKNIKPEQVYGTSATPWRTDNADLLIEGALGNRIIDISARQLISEGFLVKPIIRFLAAPPQKLKKSYAHIYSKYIIENEQRNNMVIRGAEKLVEQGYQTLVLFHNLKHGALLFDEISKRIPCALLSGKDDTKQRKKIKEELISGKLNCVIASKIYEAGVDIPSLSGLIMAGAGKSSVRALQKVGRIIRPYPGKTCAAVIDFADQTTYLSDHAKIRRDVYAEEFEVEWPGEKAK